MKKIILSVLLFFVVINIAATDKVYRDRLYNTITLYEDSTFKIIEPIAGGSFTGEGKWYFNNDTIILNTFLQEPINEMVVEEKYVETEKYKYNIQTVKNNLPWVNIFGIIIKTNNYNFTLDFDDLKSGKEIECKDSILLKFSFGGGVLVINDIVEKISSFEIVLWFPLNQMKRYSYSVFSPKSNNFLISIDNYHDQKIIFENEPLIISDSGLIRKVIIDDTVEFFNLFKLISPSKNETIVPSLKDNDQENNEISK